VTPPGKTALVFPTDDTYKTARSLLMTDLSPEQIAAFRQHGFLALPEFAPIDELQAMRGIFERLFRDRIGW
jgi:hypothetical protein